MGDFANQYFGNPEIPEYRKFSAFHRNLIANESAIAGLSGEYDTGKKPAMEIGLKEILIALGVLTAAGGGLAIAKKYDIGMDDISATIAYLEAQTGISSVDTPVQVQADLQQNQLSGEPTPVPTVANATVKETPVPQPNYFDKDLGKGFYIEGTPSFVNNITRLMETWKEVDPEVYNDHVGHYVPIKIVESRDNYSWFRADDVIEIPEGVELLGGSNDSKGGIPAIFAEWENALNYHKLGHVKSFKEQEKTGHDYSVRLGLLTQTQADEQVKHISGKIDNGTYLDNAKLNQT